ncbi:hypothetical protein M427DRAFT_140918 [Gonapodya prolifera JEL478]|uniref:SEC7 domain-containing protein n=1 Tax=Gonapodya prolifera (strain JEL478) TaxID=1344416 RepID=A0A138ZY21_GONPJ|nr:hypothetical protein M427DRAFT_140918 [Gonapodya prolifera JEL478]|eukprot:KXS09402.1 hypothetical protein M427DRAFT_140918 [Gonapodya prolifera JEL478]
MAGGVVLRQSLEKLYGESASSVGVFGSYGSSAAGKGIKELREVLKTALADLTTAEKDGANIKWEGFGDSFWTPFHLSCQPFHTVRLREVALDCISKLIAHGILLGATTSNTSSVVSTVPLQSPAVSLSPSTPATWTATVSTVTGDRVAGQEPLEIVDQDHEGLPSSNLRPPASPNARTVNLGTSGVTYATVPLLIDDIVSIVGSCFQGSQTDDAIQLAVVKCITTILTSARCEVHGPSLLRCAQTLVDLASFSRNPVHQNAARAGLTQIANLVVHRSESYTAKYLPLVQALESSPHAVDPSLAEVLQFVSNGGKIEDFPLSAKLVTPARNEPNIVVSPKSVNQDASVTGNDSADGSVTKQEQSEDADESAVPTPMTSKETFWSTDELEVRDGDATKLDRVSQPVVEQNVAVRGESTPVAPVAELSEAEGSQQFRAEDTISVRPDTDATPLRISAPISPLRVAATARDTVYANPYDPPFNYYRNLVLSDTYLLFRLFVQLSMHSPTPATALTPSDLPQSVLKTRALALELIFAMLRAGGPQFRSDNRILGTIRSGLCLSLSRNAVVANDPHLFELGVSVYVSLMLGYRAVLKKELEVLSNNIFLHVLDMGSSSQKQKATVLAGIAKLATDGQLLGDLYLNYDCEMDSVGVFEKIVEVCGKTARTRVAGPLDGRTALDEEWSLRKQALAVLIRVVEGLVDWAGNTVPSATGIIGQKGVTILTGDKGRLAQVSAEERDSFDSNGAGGGKKSLDERRLSTSSPRPSSTTPASKPNMPSGNPSPAIIHPSNPLASVSVESLKMGSQFYKSPNGSNSNMNLASVGSETLTLSSTPGDVAAASQVSVTISEDISDRQTPEQLAQRKSLLKSVIHTFNQRPQKGLKLFQTHGFVPSPLDPTATCRFFRTTPGITKTALGEIFGGGEKENISIMHSWIDSMDFAGKEFVDALRTMLQTFRLPGEAQKIDRIVEKFADRYLECNPESFASADTVYTLAFSVIMLNVDQHSVKVKTRMDKSAFIKNNRGINAGGDLPEDLLSRIFDEIASDEIVLEEERVDAEAKRRELARSDRERTEMYRREMTQMQKRSQTLMKQAREDARWLGPTFGSPTTTPRVGVLPGSTLDYSVVASTFKSADNPELARVMFRSVCWNLLATFSLLFEAEGVEVWEDESSTIALLESRVKELASGAVKNRLSLDPFGVAELCLLGFTSCVRLASVFRLETERHAWVSALLKMASLNQVSSMKPKNAKVVRTIIVIGNVLGEYLDGSWLDVLMAVSLLEKAQLIDAGGSRGALTVPRSIPANQLSLENQNASNARGSSQIEAPGSSHGADWSIPGSSVNSLSSSTESDTSHGRILVEFKNQELVVAIDRLFSGTVGLSGDALLFFVKSLCAVSADEVGMDATAIAVSSGLVPLSPGGATNASSDATPSSRRPSASSGGNAQSMGSLFPTGSASFAGGFVRMYSLQKVVEVASYNMSRIRFEFSRLWKVLQPYFNAMGTHPDIAVATFAVDSLRQLSYKFLERDELSHYNTQSEFLRSFEHVMRHTTNASIRELIVQSVHQMVASRARNIRSGWRSIWNVLSRATHDEDLPLIKSAFSVLELVFSESLEVVINAGGFADYIACLKDFAQTQSDETVVGSIRLLRGCALKLNELGPSARLLIIPRGATSLGQLPVSAESGANDKVSRLSTKPEPSSDGWEGWRDGDAEIPGMATEQQFYLMWFPILSALSRLVIDSTAQSVRTSALESLSEVLATTGHLFSPVFWRNIKRSVILPLFEGLGTLNRQLSVYDEDDDNAKLAKARKMSMIPPTESSIWIQGLREIVDLTTSLFGTLADPLELVDMVMDLIATFVEQRNENIASTGAICLQRFLRENVEKFGDNHQTWAVVTSGVARAFHMSLPRELMEWDYAIQAPKIFNAPKVSDIEGSKFASGPVDNGMTSEVPKDESTSSVISQTEQASASSLSGLEIQMSNNGNEGTSNEQRTGDGSRDTPRTSKPASLRRTSTTLDFELVVLRAAVHLEIVQTLRDIALSSSGNPPTPSQASSNARSPTKQPSDMTSPSGTLISSLPLDVRCYWLHLFNESWDFAHTFNTDTQRRQAIFRKGYVPQMPNLSKQEATSMAAWLRLMFVCYAIGGDEERLRWREFDAPLNRQSSINVNIVSGEYTDEGLLVDILVREVNKVLEDYSRFMTDTKRYHRELVQWAPVVVVVYQGLVMLTEYYGSKVPQGSEQDTTTTTHVKMRHHLRGYFRHAIKCMSSERDDLRSAIQIFMEKMADDFMTV